MVTMSQVALKKYGDFTGDFFGIYLDMLWDIDGIFSQKKFHQSHHGLAVDLNILCDILNDTTTLPRSML